MKTDLSDYVVPEAALTNLQALRYRFSVSVVTYNGTRDKVLTATDGQLVDFDGLDSQIEKVLDRVLITEESSFYEYQSKPISEIVGENFDNMGILKFNALDLCVKSEKDSEKSESVRATRKYKYIMLYITPYENPKYLEYLAEYKAQQAKLWTRFQNDLESIVRIKFDKNTEGFKGLNSYLRNYIFAPANSEFQPSDVYPSRVDQLQAYVTEFKRMMPHFTTAGTREC